MLVFEITGGVSILLMAFAIFQIWKNFRTARGLDRQRCEIVGYHKSAEELLQRARHIATISGIDQPFAVCDHCGVIRSRYVRDENGITCIECAERHTERQ